MPYALAVSFPRLAVLLFALAAACGGSSADDPDGGAVDAEPIIADAAYPPPRDDLVPPVGTATTLDVAAWNIENFPSLPSTPEVVADLITSMRLDLIAVEEIADVAAFDELVERLPNHDGVLSSHTYGDGTYQKIGFIYRTDLLDLSAASLLFSNDWYGFPRPALRATFTVDDGVHPVVDFVAIAVHLKAGSSTEDRDRRTQAMVELEDYVTQLVAEGSEPEVLVLGDCNEVLTSSDGLAVFEPWREPAGDYTIQTLDLANSGEETFLPSGAILDHQITTAGFSDELSGASVVIPHLDEQYSSYEYAVSDHLPVVLRMPILD